MCVKFIFHLHGNLYSYILQVCSINLEFKIVLKSSEKGSRYSCPNQRVWISIVHLKFECTWITLYEFQIPLEHSVVLLTAKLITYLAFELLALYGFSCSGLYQRRKNIVLSPEKTKITKILIRSPKTSMSLPKKSIITHGNSEHFYDL